MNQDPAARFNNDIADCLSFAESIRKTDPDHEVLYGIRDGVIITERLERFGDDAAERVRSYRGQLTVALDKVRGRASTRGNRYRSASEALADISRLARLASELGIDVELARPPYVHEQGLDVSQIVEWADPAGRLTSSAEAYSRFANQLHADMARTIAPVVRDILAAQATSDLPGYRIH